ncbi:MAG: DUF2059 domain-containing protein [Paracoccaceae bacterium]|nr:DUF2059 domain-containing protein [Paracoccaceae bacterium]
MARAVLRLALPFLALMLSVSSLRASDVRDLYEAMRLGDILHIMREEGLAYGEDLRSEMFPDQAAMGWPRVIDNIYALDRMEAEFVGPFEEAVGDTDLEPLIAFFNSERGQEIVEFEVTARRALLDEAVEATAKQIWEDLQGELDPRQDLIERFVDANDLIEANVAGAMNSSLAFYEGLATADSFDGAWTLDRILSTVWEQEAEIRADTRDWIYPYLTLAFEPLGAEDIEAYIALSESAEGQALNAALFSAFDVLFVNISRDIGEAAALYLQGQDI